MVDGARAAVPPAKFSAVLDCGDDAGAAQAALRIGADALVFTGRADVGARLAGIAAARGIRLFTKRPAADLDLAGDFFADAASLRQRCLTTLAAFGSPGIRDATQHRTVPPDTN